MEVAQKYGVVFNPKKTCQGLSSEILWMPLWRVWVHLNPEKADDVQALPTPTNVTELQEFLGMVMCLSPIIPLLSILTAPLCELLKKDTEFNRDASYQAAFQCVNDAVASDTTLWYFDASCTIAVQIDASQVGHGATLLQDSKPVDSARKTLTEVEHYYANIECEMLAVIFGAEWLRTYVYGRPFTTESDHMLLESITTKSLVDTPAQLQHVSTPAGVWLHSPLLPW